MPLVCCLCFAFSCAFQFYAAMCFQVGCASHWPMGRTVATCADVSSPRGHVMHCADVSTGELTWPLESERGPQLISPAPLALLCRGHCHSSCVREYTDLRHQGQVLQSTLPTATPQRAVDHCPTTCHLCYHGEATESSAATGTSRSSARASARPGGTSSTRRGGTGSAQRSVARGEATSGRSRVWAEVPRAIHRRQLHHHCSCQGRPLH